VAGDPGHHDLDKKAEAGPRKDSYVEEENRDFGDTLDDDIEYLGNVKELH
jgi:hypothetical protein